MTIPNSALDFILTAQIAVAWAGEKGEDARLGWWRCDLVSEYGGMDLFQRLLPETWKWAVLQAVREAARRQDAALRQQDHDPDRLFSIFSLGFELDEQVEERLQDLKRAGKDPEVALPGLNDVVIDPWDAEGFADWVGGHGDVKHTTAPSGRRLKGNPPAPEHAVKQLVAALLPLADAYPLPHYRKPA